MLHWRRAIAIESAPFTGRVLPSSASSPTIAYSIEQLALELPAAGEDADGDRQIERAGAFGQLRRGKVDHARDPAAARSRC